MRGLTWILTHYFPQLFVAFVDKEKLCFRLKTTVLFIKETHIKIRMSGDAGRPPVVLRETADCGPCQTPWTW